MLSTAGIILVVLLFLTKPLQYMPDAVLASVVFIIGVELVDLAGMRKVFGVRPDEFIVAADHRHDRRGRRRRAGGDPRDGVLADRPPAAQLRAQRLGARSDDRRAPPTRHRWNRARARSTGSSSTTSPPASTTPTRTTSPRRYSASQPKINQRFAGWASTPPRSRTSTSAGRETLREARRIIARARHAARTRGGHARRAGASSTVTASPR